MDESIYKILVGLACFLFIVIRGPHVKESREAKISKIREGRRERLLVGLNYVSMMVLPLVYVFTTWLNPFTMYLPDAIRLSSAVLFLSGLVLFWWSHASLGSNWSNKLELREDHKLITSGPYRFIRHPMYLYFYIYVLSLGLLSSNILILVSGFMTWTLLYVVRVPDEEKMMIDEFGEQYKQYMKETGRIIPKIL